MSGLDRIDVHTHFVPSFWGEALEEHGGDPSGWKLPQWSAEAHLRYKDDQQIATSILSLTAPSVAGWAGQERRDIARKINEYTAELANKHSGRFGYFATVPLPDVEGAVLEAEYALDKLNADGVVLLTNYKGVYLGDPMYAPLWEALNKRSTVAFIHPGFPILELLHGIPGPMVDYPFDTTRNAVHMARFGVLDNYPDTRIILSHAGGFLPYVSMRAALVAELISEHQLTVDQVLAKLRRYYFDTALSSGPMAMPSLLAFADHERILFGSDFPYAPAAGAARFNAMLDDELGLSEAQKIAINRSNAQRLFKRLAG